MSTSTNEDVELNTMIAIVKHIVNVKLAEISARNQAKAKREQQQKILSILNAKENEALQNKSIDELQAMLAELE